VVAGSGTDPPWFVGSRRSWVMSDRDDRDEKAADEPPAVRV